MTGTEIPWHRITPNDAADNIIITANGMSGSFIVPAVFFAGAYFTLIVFSNIFINLSYCPLKASISAVNSSSFSVLPKSRI